MSIHLDLPDANYRARPALSYSGAKTLMRSPAAFHYELTHPRPPKTAFDLGHAAHKLILGEGAELVVVRDPGTGEPYGDWRKAAAKEQAADARAAGRVPLLQSQLDDAQAMADAVLRHPVAGRLFERGAGHPEVSAFWEQDGVPCRARFDWLLEELDGRPVLVDAKTTDDVSDHALERVVDRWRYHWQDVSYRAALTAHGVDDAGFVFVFVETDPPHLVRVVELDDAWRASAELSMRDARALYADCLASGQWPGFPPEIHLLGRPRWAARHPEEH